MYNNSPFFIVPSTTITENVRSALQEDIGKGDITAQLIPSDKKACADVITRESCTFCGKDWFSESIKQVDKTIEILWHVNDGERLTSNQLICTLTGSARTIVTAERTAINFIQTLSATATRSSQYAEQVSHTETIILDTRKTIPGLRLAQKYAVSCGGCQNHRIGLYDAFLIKENHILACEGISNAIAQARKNHSELAIEVEVENTDELNQAIQAGADRVMLDNFSIDALKQAIPLCKDKIETEISGNVTLSSLKALAETGVNYISTGALTKDIQSIDFSMRFK